VVCAVAIVSFAGVASARGDQVDEHPQLEQIIVTAQRKAQQVQDVPITMTAFSPADIERLQIDNLADVTRVSPNVKFDTATGGTNSLKAYIRGGGATDSPMVTSEPEVAIYVDDVYYGRLSGALLDFIELQRIEVLRGPQGVLYGRNSSSGAVKLVTREPSDHLTGSIEVSFGRWNERRARAYLSGALSEDGAWRAAFSGMIKSRDGGRQYNETLNKKVGAEDFEGAKADLAYVGNNLRGRLSVFYMNSDSDGLWAVSHRPDGRGGYTPYSGSYYRVLSPLEESFSRHEQYGATLRLETDIAGGTLTSITGYSEQEGGWRVDFSGGVPPSAINMPGTTPLALMDRTSIEEQHQFSQEVQLAGDFGSGRFDYVVGLYYFKEDSEQFLDTITFFAPTETALLPKTESYAAFGQLTYNVTDDFAVMLGGRQSIDKKELVASLGGVDVVRSDRWERFTPKLGLQYKLNRDVLLYASFSEGFKSGGYNGLASNAAQLALPFQPQITRAYEAGIKSDLLDYTLRMNLSVFRNEIEGRQQVINTGDGGFINENYDVRIQGLEAELSWNVFRNLTLWLQGALNDGKYTDLKTSLIGVLGDEIPSLPDYQYTIGFDYSTIAGSGTLSFGSDFMVRDQFYVDAGNTPIAWVPKQELLGAYIGYEIDRWTFKLRGKNLTQTESWQTGFGFSVVQPRIIIDPRTWMFTASYKF